MAMQLAGLHHQIKLKPIFFEAYFVRGKLDRLTTRQDLERRAHICQALDAFRAAFPKRFEEYELRLARRKEGKCLLQELKGIPSSSLIPMQTHSNGPDSEQNHVINSLLQYLKL
jgi:hypothetical protein